MAVAFTVTFTGFPVSLGQPRVAEHLKQAAKVRGLGVERQLKVPGCAANKPVGLNL